MVKFEKYSTWGILDFETGDFECSPFNIRAPLITSQTFANPRPKNGSERTGKYGRLALGQSKHCTQTLHLIC